MEGGVFGFEIGDGPLFLSDLFICIIHEEGEVPGSLETFHVPAQ